MTLSETINILRNQGYVEDFNLPQSTDTSANSTNGIFDNRFTIDHYFRFEGESNPSDSSILYAISAVESPRKGILVNAYGIYSEPRIDEIVEKLAINGQELYSNAS